MRAAIKMASRLQDGHNTTVYKESDVQELEDMLGCCLRCTWMATISPVTNTTRPKGHGQRLGKQPEDSS
jgi:hypothetical protein